MSSRRGSSVAIYVYGGSLLLHAALGVGTVLLPKPVTSTTTAITLVQEKKKAEPPKPPPPPPPPPKHEDKPKPKANPQPQPQQQQAKVAPEAKTEAPPPVPVGNDGFADLGMALGNSDGPGLAVPGAAAGPAAGATPGGARAAPVATKHKVEHLDAPTQGASACNDPVVHPKARVPVAPKYTMEARQAEIEGVVRIEVTVDESGRVIHARVINGLGYGLDEAALEAAKATTFDPATQCGKPVVGTRIIAIRFELT